MHSPLSLSYCCVLFSLCTVAVADCSSKALRPEDLEALNLTWVHADKTSNTSIGWIVPHEKRQVGQRPSTLSYSCYEPEFIYQPEVYHRDFIEAQLRIEIGPLARGSNRKSYPASFKDHEGFNLLCDTAEFHQQLFEWPVKSTGSYLGPGKDPAFDRLIVGGVPICLPGNTAWTSVIFCGFITHRDRHDPTQYLPINRFDQCQIVPGTGAA